MNASETETKLSWHYGPTEADKDPVKMWCDHCGGLVMFIDDAFICGGCNRVSE